MRSQRESVNRLHLPIRAYRLAALCSLPGLAGCWWNASLPGTIAYDRRMRHEADSLAHVANTGVGIYLDCMTAYARGHTRTEAAATAIAVAADVSCQGRRYDVRAAQISAYERAGAANPYALAQRDGDMLSGRGRDMVVALIVEARSRP